MAISPVIANCVQVRLLWVVGGQLAVNVLNSSAASGVVVNQALADTLGSAIKTTWTTNLAPRMVAGTSLVRVAVRDMRVPNSTEFLDGGAAVVGTGVGDALPPNVAACITFRTAQSGKSFRGRAYIGGFSEAENTVGGLISTAASTGALNFFNGVKNNMTASNLTFAVASRPSEKVVVTRTTFHNDGTTSTKTLSTTTAKSGGVSAIIGLQSRDANWETQRRRSNGRGLPPTLFADAAMTITF